MPQILVDLRSQFTMIYQKVDDAFDFVAEAGTESGQTCFVVSSRFVQFELRVRMELVFIDQGGSAVSERRVGRERF